MNTDEILSMMEERRKVKNKDPVMHHVIHKYILETFGIPKRAWVSKKCQIIGKYEIRHDIFSIHIKIS